MQKLQQAFKDSEGTIVLFIYWVMLTEVSWKKKASVGSAAILAVWWVQNQKKPTQNMQMGVCVQLFSLYQRPCVCLMTVMMQCLELEICASNGLVQAR